MLSRPPSDSTRSRMPTSPKPPALAFGSKPLPPSTTRIVKLSSSSRTVIATSSTLGMLDGVGRGLLDDAIHGCLQFGLVPRRLAAGLPVKIDGQIDLDPAGADPICERLQGRFGPELVERRRAHVSDDASEARDLGVELLDCLAERGAPLVRVIGPPRGGQRDPERAKALQGLVVQLPGPAPAFLLRRGLTGAQLLEGERTRGHDRARRAHGE